MSDYKNLKTTISTAHKIKDLVQAGPTVNHGHPGGGVSGVRPPSHVFIGDADGEHTFKGYPCAYDQGVWVEYDECIVIDVNQEGLAAGRRYDAIRYGLDSEGKWIYGVTTLGGACYKCGVVLGSDGCLKFKADDVLGPGMGVIPGEGEEDCDKISPVVGCGLEINEDTGEIQLKLGDVLGKFLEQDGETGCKIKVNAGCHIEEDPEEVNLMSVDLSTMVGPGIKEVDSEEPLGCSHLEANIGCGLHFTEGGQVIAVKPSDLAGKFLKIEEEGCGLTLDLSCHLKEDEETLNELIVDLSSMIGPGLVEVDSEEPLGCSHLEADIGCGLKFSEGGNKITVKSEDLAGDGLLAGDSGCQLVLDLPYIATALPACGLEKTGDHNLRVKRSDLIGKFLKAGAGTCNIAVDNGCHLYEDPETANELAVNLTSIAGTNTGLAQEEGDPGDCDHLKVDLGCNMILSGGGNQVTVDTTAICGDGLEPVDTCAITVKLDECSMLAKSSDGLRVDLAALVDGSIGLTTTVDGGGGGCARLDIKNPVSFNFVQGPITATCNGDGTITVNYVDKTFTGWGVVSDPV